MGAPMASHLAAAGHPLVVHDAAPGVADALAATLAGARAAASLDALARASEIVVTMVPNGRVVQSLVEAPGGLAEGLAPGSLLIDTSSSEPWLTERTGALLAARGVAMVDAPVSGARHGAEAADLVFMCGGAAADLARARPILEVMGKSLFHLGPLGAGHAMKSLNNLVTAVNLQALSEVLVVGKRHGLDPEAMVDVLDRSTGGSWVSKTLIRRFVLSRAFDDPFKLALMNKDIGIAMQLARESATPAPLAALAEQSWRAAGLAGAGDASVVEIARWVERQGGAEIAAGSGHAVPAAAKEAPRSVTDKP